MATFLQLVNDIERESGTIQKGARLATVANPPARQEKIVEWVREAWILIQNSRSDWKWLTAEFEGLLAVSTARYASDALEIGNFSRWMQPSADNRLTIYDPLIGKSEEAPIHWITWAEYRARWDRGTHDANRPVEVAMAPDGRLCFGPTPDKAYVVRGEYYRTAQVLTDDADLPLCPADHHNVIVWRALMLLGDHDEGVPVVAQAQAKYQAAYRALVDNSCDKVTL